MVVLEIDGQPVDLGKDSTFDYYSYNPLLDTKNSRGEFSYDIDIDLGSANNAKIYKNFNRINSTTEFTGRKACLIVDGLLFAEGQEVIIECSQTTAKIQLVCDAHMSEHVFNDKIRMIELDLGTLPEYTAETALATLNAEPLSVPAVCTPVLVKNNNNDNYSFSHTVDNRGNSSFDARDMFNFASINDLWSEGGSWQGTTTFIGQPYLVIVVERVLQALGWKIVNNVLRRLEYAKRMVVVHGYYTREINKMIPNWTVSEFFEQIQIMFNVVFASNKNLKTVAIVPAGSYFVGDPAVVNINKEDVIRIENKPERKFEGLDDILLEYNGLRYNLPSEDYGNRADISDEVHEITSVIDFSDFSVINSFSSQYRTQEFYNKPYFLRHTPTGTKWMLAKGRNDMSFQYQFVRVDQFAHVSSSDDDKEETVLKIVPVETIVMSIQNIDENENVTFAAGIVVPFARSSGIVDPIYNTSEESGLNEWVGGSMPKALDTKSDNLYVAQYLGRTSTLYDHSLDAYSGYARAKYPQVFTHRYINGYINYRWYWSDWQGSWQQTALDALWDKPLLEDKITFSLKKRLETTYKSQAPFKNTEIHTVFFKFRAKADVNSVFNIAGREFACISLQYQVRNGKLLPYVIGKFLPLL